MNRPESAPRLFGAADVRLGRQRSPQHESGPHMIPYLRAANVKDGALDLSDVKLMNFDPSEQRTFSLHPGDILVTEGSGSIGAVGASAVWKEDLPGTICFQNTLVRLRPRPGVSDGRYLGWWARAAYASGQFASIASGANIYHISAERLKGLPAPLPPLDEQRRIADFLDAETAQIDRTATIRENAKMMLLERRAAGVFSAVTGSSYRERIPSNLAWVDTLPAMWQGVKLSYVARMGSGHTPSRDKAEWWMDCTIPWITTGEVSQMRSDRLEVLTETRERISEIGLANSSAEIHPRDTVVLCRTAASAGYSAVMGRDMATSQDLATWTCGPNLNPFYLLWRLRAMRTDLLDRLAMGSTHKTIYMPDLNGLRVPLPGIDEQARVVEVIRSSNADVDSVIDCIDRQLALLAERRQALITSAVTGQIDVTTARGVST